jgi:spoIIIJ-associated protein
MTNKIKIQAKTLPKALEQAATELGVGLDAVQYEIISQTDGGLFGFLGARKIELMVWTSQRKGRNPRRSTRSETEQQESREPLSESETQELVEDLTSFCRGICERMAGETCDVTSTLEDGRLSFNINNEYIQQQIGRNSKIAESLEHLLRKKPRYLKRELPFRIFIDVAGLRMNRESELVSMACDLSSKVQKSQRPIVLNYKSAYDRKIIHMALDKDEHVYTKSIGTGTNRKLMILPAKGEADIS